MVVLRKFAIFSFGILLLISCGKDEKQGQNQAKDKVENRAKSQMLGTVINSVPVITADHQAIVKAWNVILQENGFDETLETVAIEKINSTYFVVARGEGIRSVRAISFDDNQNTFVDTKVTCTTTDCSSTPMCFPEGNTCRPCEKAEHKCTKIISSWSI